MKRKKKSKSRSKHQTAHLPVGMQPTHVISKSRASKDTPHNTFTAMETGQPDQDFVPGINNPQGVQGGHGPLNQEGEGERQNDQLAELEQIEPEI
jgi:hypothetical protein